MTMPADEKEKSRAAGLKVLLMLVAFFLLIAGVNAIFIYKAVATHTGTIVDSPYERGLDYNKTLAAARAQEKFDWRVAVGIEKMTELQYEVSLFIHDSKGNGKDAVLFDVAVLRPVDSREDLTPVFKAEGVGKYSSHIRFPKPGKWEVKARVVRGAETFYLTRPLVIE